MEPIFKTNPYTDTTNPAVAATGIKETPDTSKANDSPKTISAKPDFDRYTPEEKHTSIGLYHVDADDSGKRKISFDAPEHTDDESAAPSEAAPNPAKETCRGNTDKVDREIKELKQKKKELESRLRTETNEAQAEALEKELAKVERELSQKDNDSYRRQHTIFS